MNGDLSGLCAAARTDFAATGELGRPLVAVVDLVGATAGQRGVGVLADPTFVLELLHAPASDAPALPAALVGCVLDHLRHRAGVVDVAVDRLTVARAADEWEREGMALRAPSTRSSYRTWTRRLAAVAGEADVATVTAVDLANLIADHTRSTAPARGHQRGRAAEETAVSAFRNFWAYLVDRGAVSRNIALSLRKPIRNPPHRRPIRTDEATVLRQVARMGADPLLTETALCLVERLGIRPLELGRLHTYDVDLAHAEVTVVGKNDHQRRLPLPPRLASLLERYRADRGLTGGGADGTPFLRRRSGDQRGEQLGVHWIDELVPRLLRGAPQLVAPDELCLYSYRHAIATWTDAHHGRAMTRRILGHTARLTATDHYVHVDEDAIGEAVANYEAHLLQAFGA